MKNNCLLKKHTTAAEDFLNRPAAKQTTSILFHNVKVCVHDKKFLLNNIFCPFFDNIKLFLRHISWSRDINDEDDAIFSFRFLFW